MEQRGTSLSREEMDMVAGGGGCWEPRSLQIKAALDLLACSRSLHSEQNPH